MKKNKNNRSHRRGFTLIELLVVISIIGTLSTIALTSLNGARAKARDARRKSDLEQMVLAMDQYYAQYGTYKISGTGSSGGGQGWFNYIGGTSYKASIAGGLKNAGYFSTPPRDPQITSDSQTTNGNARQYMLYLCSSGGYYFFTRLENPSSTDYATFNASCGKDFGIDKDPYKMNYAAGRR